MTGTPETPAKEVQDKGKVRNIEIGCNKLDRMV